MIRAVSLPAAGTLLAAALLLAAPAVPAFADPFDPFLGAAVDPVSLGLGGAVSTIGVGHAALEGNPAAMAQIRQYALQAGYTNTGDPTRHGVHVSAVDSLINPNLALGVSYAYRSLQRDFNGEMKKGGGHRVRGGLALAERWPTFQLLAGIGMNWNTEQIGTVDRSLVNVDAGVLAMVGEFARLGFTASNLIDHTDQDQPRELTGGAGLVFQRVQIGYDARTDLDSDPEGSKLTHSVGAQIVPIALLPVRLGYRRDGLNDTNAITGGFSLITPRFALDAAYGQELDGIKRRWVALALRYFLRY